MCGPDVMLGKIACSRPEDVVPLWSSRLSLSCVETLGMGYLAQLVLYKMWPKFKLHYPLPNSIIIYRWILKVGFRHWNFMLHASLKAVFPEPVSLKCVCVCVFFLRNSDFSFSHTSKSEDGMGSSDDSSSIFLSTNSSHDPYNFDCRGYFKKHTACDSSYPFHPHYGCGHHHIPLGCHQWLLSRTWWFCRVYEVQFQDGCQVDHAKIILKTSWRPSFLSESRVHSLR